MWGRKDKQEQPGGRGGRKERTSVDGVKSLRLWEGSMKTSQIEGL